MENVQENQEKKRFEEAADEKSTAIKADFLVEACLLLSKIILAESTSSKVPLN